MRTPLKDRVPSPSHGLLLMPNDDEKERAQMRRAREAELRRKSGIGAGIFSALASVPAPQEATLLSWEHILELHRNCIKLAAENVCLPCLEVTLCSMYLLDWNTCCVIRLE